jgi:hypothetical protein
MQGSITTGLASQGFSTSVMDVWTNLFNRASSNTTTRTLAVLPTCVAVIPAGLHGMAFIAGRQSAPLIAATMDVMHPAWKLELEHATNSLTFTNRVVLAGLHETRLARATVPVCIPHGNVHATRGIGECFRTNALRRYERNSAAIMELTAAQNVVTYRMKRKTM